MAAYFFDSSSLVKRYTKEMGTSWVFSLVRPSANNRLYLARIAGAEVITALTRKERTGEISGAEMNKSIRRFEREYANKFVLVEVTPAVVQGAMNYSQKISFARLRRCAARGGIISRPNKTKRGSEFAHIYFRRQQSQ